MHELLSELIRRQAVGESVIVCTVVKTKGSTPQAAGARMLVLADGRTVGTLGGGCVEAEVRSRALQARGAETFRFSLDRDYGWDDGLICGGVMDVHVDPSPDAAMYSQVVESLSAGASAAIVLPYTLDGQSHVYREELGPPPTVLVVGAGHVGRSVAELAAKCQFNVDVIDDRPDHLSAERFPTARRIVGDVAIELSKYAFGPDTYIVIVTRGHRGDASALAAVINSPAKYVGLIGSKRKIKAIYDELYATGVSAEKLAAVHAPIGLDIGAVTVDEIGVSIVAELIAARRGGGVGPMKLSADEVARWVGRLGSPGADTTPATIDVSNDARP